MSIEQAIEKCIRDETKFNNSHYAAKDERSAHYLLGQAAYAREMKLYLDGLKCKHEWVSSVAYKGARVCTKCGVIK